MLSGFAHAGIFDRGLLTPMAIFTATSCSQANVQTAVNSAIAAGGTNTVQLPSCSQTNYSSSVNVNISSGSLTIQGNSNTTNAGQTTGFSSTDATNIGDNTGGSGAFALTVTGTGFVSLSNISFFGVSANTAGMVQIDGTFFKVNGWRVHHNHFHAVGGGGAHRGMEIDSVYGLIDHNIFDGTPAQSIGVSGTPGNSDGGITAWLQPLQEGSINAMYIEDNTFNIDNAGTDDSVDAYSGARLVIRYNALLNAHVGFHGTDSGSTRSMLWVEVYNNHFINNSPDGARNGTMRGGSGVWFNNIYGGSHAWDGLTLQSFRFCGTNYSTWGPVGPNLNLGSTDPNNIGSRTLHTSTAAPSSSNVYLCSGNKERLCAATSDCTAHSEGTCSVHFDGTGTGNYPAHDQVGMSPGQVENAVYGWSNTGFNMEIFDGGSSCVGGLPLSTLIATPRNYINNGTTPKPGYTPFVYPHPLQGTTTVQPPAPSAGLFAKSF